MINLIMLKVRFDRWLCSLLGHRPDGSSSSDLAIPIKVLCGRCGDPITVIR